MIILRSNFYSSKKDDREISGSRSVKSGLKAAGLTIGLGTANGALGLGTLSKEGAKIISKNPKLIKRSARLGGVGGAIVGAGQSLVPALVVGTGYGLYKYASGHKKKKKNSH